jgi:hypothetical protein
LYFGKKDLPARIESSVTEEYDNQESLKHTAKIWIFVDLYILADKLLDLITANFVMDELVGFSGGTGWTTNETTVAHVYASTTDGNLLSKLMRDWYMHDNDPSWSQNMSQEQWEVLPFDFLRDIVVETDRRKQAHSERRVKHNFNEGADTRKKVFYHQKMEKKSEAS